jgi:hypothetical protein
MLNYSAQRSKLHRETADSSYQRSGPRNKLDYLVAEQKSLKL